MNSNLNIEQISRAAWEMEHPPSTDPPEDREVNDLELLVAEFGLDLLPEQIEIFAAHLKNLRAIGVRATDPRILSTLEAYPHNTEAAVEAVMEYFEFLRQSRGGFESETHATNCFAKALRGDWDFTRIKQKKREGQSP